MSALRINISNLSDGTHQRSLEANPGEIGLDSRLSAPIRLEATLEKTSRQLFLQVEFKTGGLFTCDRCLDEFEREVVGSYRVVYATGDCSGAGREQEEIQIISPDMNYVDLDEDVRQYAILAIPQKALCREDCAGLCSTCGANLNRTACSCNEEEAEPRWAGLKKALKN